MTVVNKPLITSQKKYDFGNSVAIIKKVNNDIASDLKKNQKRLNDGIKYAAQFRAK